MLAVIGMVFYGLVMLGVQKRSGTADEFVHVTGGVSYWTLNDFRLHPENGNWPQRLLALPLVIGDATFPSLEQDAWRSSNAWKLSDQFFFGPGADADEMLAGARRMAAVVGVMLGVLIFCWSRSIFGSGGAWVSLVVFAFSPTMLAHAGLATSDVTATMFFLAATWALWVALHRITPMAVAVSVLATAGLFLSKFSALVFIPVAVSMLGVRLLSSRPLDVELRSHHGVIAGRRRLPWFAGLTLVHLVGVAAIIWGSFGFRYSAFHAAVTGRERFSDPWSEVIDSSFVSRTVQFARSRELLPEAYLFGLSTVLAYSKHRSAFLNGEVSQSGGWRWFFPYAALVKTTLAELALTIVLGVVIVRRLLRRRDGPADASFDPYDLIPLLLLVGWYWAFAISSRLNIGHRHLLPAAAGTIVLLGAVADPIVRARRVLASWPRSARVA